jgi:hypothetical protein
MTPNEIIPILNALVEEIKKLNENLENHADKLEYVGHQLDGLSTEIFKYRLEELDK